MHVIVLGNPIDGVKIVGDHDGEPFQDAETANEFGDAHYQDEEWWVVAITPTQRYPGDTCDGPE